MDICWRHQANALGQFRCVPPFSLPVRLFVGAKFTEGKVQLSTVRNGHGVVHDINENMVTTLQDPGPGRPRPRHHYSYAVFSTAGFSRNAQEYALAHQISLVDLSMPDFAGLRELVRSVARDEYMEYDPDPDADAHPLPESVTEPLDRLAGVLSNRSTPGLVLVFPSAPFVLGLASEDLYAFVDYARAHPTHDINLGRVQDGNHSVWPVRPAAGPVASVTPLAPHPCPCSAPSCGPPPIVRSIAVPPVRRKRMTREAARRRKAMLSQVV